MKINKTKPIALGIAFTLALTPIHTITYADTNLSDQSLAHSEIARDSRCGIYGHISA